MTPGPERPAAAESRARELRDLLDGGRITLADVARARALRSSYLTDDEDMRAVGSEYYPKLLRMYMEAHPNGDIASFDRVQAAVSSHPDEELETLVGAATVRFDWSAVRSLLFRLHAIDEDSRIWLNDASVRAPIRATVYGHATFLLSALDTENGRVPKAGAGTPLPPSPQHAQDLQVILPELDRIERRFRDAAQRAAQAVYAKGMLIGAGVLIGCDGRVGCGLCLVGH